MYRTIFVVVDGGVDFKVANMLCIFCEFVSNLLTAAQHIHSSSVRKPV